jgi:hypothetical protein
MKIIYRSKIYNWGETSRIMIYRCKNCYSFFIIDIEMIERLTNTMYVCTRCDNPELN